MSVKTRTRSTTKQLRMLVDYMTAHPKLAHGDFNGPQGRLLETKQWEELRAMLSEHGPDKSIDQWKVTWRDLRRKARYEASSVNSASLAPGNEVIPALSEMNRKILEVMGMEGPYDMHGDEESGEDACMSIEAVYFEDDSHEPVTVTGKTVNASDVVMPLSQSEIKEELKEEHINKDDDYVTSLLNHVKMLKNKEHTRRMQMAEEEHRINKKILEEKLKCAKLEREILELKKAKTEICREL